jgi:hypothetical protein
MFSLPAIKIDRHQKEKKIKSMAKTSNKQID